MSLRFNMLLGAAGISPVDVRLLRHQTGKVPGRTPYTLWRDDRPAFERYQSLQNSSPDQRARFAGRFWASFVVPPGGQTLFVGLYSVDRLGIAPHGTIDPLSGETVCPHGSKAAPDQYRCELLPTLSTYVGRLSVHWGASSSASRAWVQRADNQDKEIIELTREFRDETFPGFTRFTRPLSEIESMPASWKEVLRSSRGIYLLACPRTREHYVGAAYGESGFLGRWRDYIDNLHGGNAALRLRDPSDYLVSILEVVGSSMTSEDTIRLEDIWKRKLLSRDIGLNNN